MNPTGLAPVVVTRTYKATLEDVWSLWTTKDGFTSWWGPQGFRVEVHALEPRAGGALHYAMIAAAPEMVAAMAELGREASHPVHARFTAFEPITHLVISSVIDFLPGVAPYESTIGLALEAVGDHVRMVVTLGVMHDETFMRMSQEGFTSQLTKLDARFGWSEA